MLILSQFAISNRAELIRTKGGNILWDLIPFLDQETVDKVSITLHITVLQLTLAPDKRIRWIESHRNFSSSLLLYLGGLVSHMQMPHLRWQAGRGVVRTSRYARD